MFAHPTADRDRIDTGTVADYQEVRTVLFDGLDGASLVLGVVDVKTHLAQPLCPLTQAVIVLVDQKYL